jgi:UDPglucose--hexose-1-phosphate uridylyltransferase
MSSWEKRWNPLRSEWIIYAAHRNKRPWDGESFPSTKPSKSYLSDCYLCPGNLRVSGHRNPDYKSVFIFDNDHPVVGPDAPDTQTSLHDDLYLTGAAKGFAKVICYDPNHNKTMTDLPVKQLVEVLSAWQEVTQEAKDKSLAYTLIFENKGAITGVSNLHPHCQVYATDFIFNYSQIEQAQAAAYRSKNNASLFEAIIAAEQTDGRRIIAENDQAIAFIPFFAKYAYEVMLFPKSQAATLLDLTEVQLAGIADIYQELIQKYDRLFSQSFPYVMSVMQAPLKDTHPDYRTYFHFQPPLRVPGVRKYLAGPEIGGGNFMADTLPEESAEKLSNA